MHSALKFAGKPFYSYARAGETLVRQPREIIIKNLHLIELKGEVASISVHCSKGTYIRVLAEDIGRALGCGGYLLALRRTGIRDLPLSDAIALDRLGEMDEPGRLAALLPVDRLVEAFPAVHLSSQASQRIQNGLVVSDEHNAATGMVRLYDSAHGFIGLGESRCDGTLVSRRLLATRPRSEWPSDI